MLCFTDFELTSFKKINMIQPFGKIHSRYKLLFFLIYFFILGKV